MSGSFCDTNVLVRLLTGILRVRLGASWRRSAARGRFVLVVPDLMLAEVAYVLGSLGMDAGQGGAPRGDPGPPGVEVADEILTRDAIAVWA